MDEVALGCQLIKAVGKSAPTLIDDTAMTIQAYVDSKAAGEPVVEATEAPATTGPDLIRQLMASIDVSKAKVPA